MMANLGLFQPVEKCCPCPYDGASYLDDFGGVLDADWPTGGSFDPEIVDGRLAAKATSTQGSLWRLACAPVSNGLYLRAGAKFWSWVGQSAGVSLRVASGVIALYNQATYPSPPPAPPVWKYRITGPWLTGGDPFFDGAEEAGTDLEIEISDANDGGGLFDVKFYGGGVLLTEELATPLSIAGPDGYLDHGLYADLNTDSGGRAYWDDYHWESSYV